MKPYEYTLADGENCEIASGSYFLLAAAAASVDIEFYGHDGSSLGTAVGVPRSFKFKTENGKRFKGRLTNNSGASLTVKYYVSDSPIDLDTTADSGVSILQATSLTDDGAVVTATASPAQSIVAASTTRKGILFQADSGNTGIITLHIASVFGTNKGIVLNAGDSYSCENFAGAAWFAISANGTETLRVISGV